jgi:hypothetical protein
LVNPSGAHFLGSGLAIRTSDDQWGVFAGSRLESNGGMTQKHLSKGRDTFTTSAHIMRRSKIHAQPLNETGVIFCHTSCGVEDERSVAVHHFNVPTKTYATMAKNIRPRWIPLRLL